MSARETVVREILDAIAAGDPDKALAHFSPDAVYHVNAWHAPVIGPEAIRAELRRQAGIFADFRYEITGTAASFQAVFTERLDSFVVGTKPVTLHWCSVHEFDADDRVVAIRDYYDMKELEAQLAR